MQRKTIKNDSEHVIVLSLLPNECCETLAYFTS